MFPKPYGLGHGQLLYKNDESFKQPMLIVGANSYIQTKVNNIINNSLDIHLFFCPTSKRYWQLSVILIPKDSSQMSYEIASFTSQDIKVAMETLINTINNTRKFTTISLKPKQDIWLSHAIYRCAKISFKDVMNLETYKESEAA